MMTAFCVAKEGGCVLLIRLRQAKQTMIEAREDAQSRAQFLHCVAATKSFRVERLGQGQHWHYSSAIRSFS